MAEESVHTKAKAKKIVAKKAVGRTASVTRTRRPVSTATAKTRASKTSSPTRKAPMTAVASVPPTQPRSRSIYLYIGLGLFITLLAAGIVIGLKDSGAINVEAVIAERKANASPEERAVIERAQQSVNLTQVPDGGLVPSTDQTMPPPEPVATTTATTSAESAAATATTSTEAAPATTSEDILVPSETIE